MIDWTMPGIARISAGSASGICASTGKIAEPVSGIVTSAGSNTAAGQIRVDYGIHL